MPRYFIKEGRDPYKEVSEKDYLKYSKEADFNNFSSAVPMYSQVGFIHKIIIGKICETQEQVKTLLSGI